MPEKISKYNLDKISGRYMRKLINFFKSYKYKSTLFYYFFVRNPLFRVVFVNFLK